MKILYRYELYHFGENICNINLIEYPVIRKTPKGYWIKNEYRGEKWVSQEARNKFAYETEKEALKSYIRRKTYRNHCISTEMERNEKTILDAKFKLRKL